MKRTGRTIAQISLVLVLILSGIAGTITTVAGQDPVNEVWAEFHTNYWSDVPGDVFVNGAVDGNKNWNADMRNAGDGTGEQVANVTSTLDSELGMPFEWLDPEPETSAHPHYGWAFGNIAEGDGANIGVGASWSSVNYEPGFDVSRSIDPLELTVSGNQTMDITVTPREEGMEWINIGVHVWEDSFLIPEIISPTTDEEADVRLSDDGRNLNVSIHNPVNGDEYVITVTVYVELKEGVASAEHMPQVQVAQQSTEDRSDLYPPTPPGSMVSHYVEGLGTWAWQADGDYQWNWRETLNKGVNLGGVQQNDVWAEFHINHWHDVSGDVFTNGEVDGTMTWTSGMHNAGDETGQPVANVTSTLDSELGMPFEWANPEPETSAYPHYEWAFGDVAQDSGTQIDVGGSWASTTFSPGFDVSRSIDPLELTESGNQTMEITVTPREEGMEWINIGVGVWEDSFVMPEIISPTTDEEAGVWLSDDGRNLGVSIQSPVNGDEYVITVTVYVALKEGVASAEHMPRVQVAQRSTVDSSDSYPPTIGSAVSRTIAGLGDWTWQADGSYQWNWRETLNKGVNLGGIQTNEVWVQYQNDCWHGIPGNEFLNGEVEGNKNWGSAMHNAGDETGQPASNVTLMLQSGLTFEWMDPAPDTSAPPQYEWSFGDIGQDEGVGIGVGTSSTSVNFTPGFDVSRSIEPLELTASGNQTLEVRVTPRQEGMEQLGIGVQVPEGSYVTPQIVSPTTDEEAGVWLSEDGRSLNLSVQGPENGTEYIVHVTIYVELPEGVASARHMPQVQVAQQSTVDSSDSYPPTIGSALSRSIAGLGDWTWQADGVYRWNWAEALTEGVILNEHSTVSFEAEYIATEKHFHLSNNGLHLYDGEVQPDGSDSIYGNLFTFTHSITPSSANIASWSYVNNVNSMGRGTISGSFTIAVHRAQCAPGVDGECFQFGDIDGSISVSFRAASYAVSDPSCEECDPSHYNFDGSFQITGGTGFYEGIHGSGSIGGTFHDHEWSGGEPPDPLEKWFDFVMIGQAKFKPQ